eukprot:m.8761 g.8761  ORF g.8761 m.8761 type:complete len:137 (+) comp5393_c0_seq1:559-969(+)
MIGSMDGDLHRQLAAIPGVPILTINNGRLHLLKASAATTRRVQELQTAKMGLQPQERVVLERERQQDPNIIKAQLALEKKQQRKKKTVGKKKGPNPLSMKKKKKQQAGIAQAVKQAIKQAQPKPKSKQKKGQQRNE